MPKKETILYEALSRLKAAIRCAIEHAGENELLTANHHANRRKGHEDQTEDQNRRGNQAD